MSLSPKLLLCWRTVLVLTFKNSVIAQHFQPNWLAYFLKGAHRPLSNSDLKQNFRLSSSPLPFVDLKWVRSLEHCVILATWRHDWFYYSEHAHERNRRRQLPQYSKLFEVQASSKVCIFSMLEIVKREIKQSTRTIIFASSIVPSHSIFRSSMVPIVVAGVCATATVGFAAFNAQTNKVKDNHWYVFTQIFSSGIVSLICHCDSSVVNNKYIYFPPSFSV